MRVLVTRQVSSGASGEMLYNPSVQYCRSREKDNRD